MKQELTLLILGASSFLLATSCEDRANATTANGGGGAASGGVLLENELPPYQVQGTVKPVKVPHLLPKPTKAPVLFVPDGTTLLSKGKKVTSSDDYPIIGSLDLITDGEKDAGEGYFVEIINGTQWVQIDLEKSAAISAVWLWHFHQKLSAYHDVVIQVSDDPEFNSGVTTLYNNDYDNSSQLGKGKDRPYIDTHFGHLVNGKGTRGRYVRLYSKGNTSNDMNHYIEVEVFGVR